MFPVSQDILWMNQAWKFWCRFRLFEQPRYWSNMSELALSEHSTNVSDLRMRSVSLHILMINNAIALTDSRKDM